MIKWRQVAWIIYKHFKLSDEDGAMLEWDELINVHLRGDNLQQFENDWNNMILNVRSLHEEAFLESVFRKQLEKSEQLKSVMALYQQDYTQRGEKKSYQKLKDMLRVHLEKKLLDKNKNALSNNLDGKALAGNKGGGKKNGQPSDNARTGDCRQWRNEGKCSRGSNCPWKASHTDEKKGGRDRSPSTTRKSKGKGKSDSGGQVAGDRGRTRTRETSPSRDGGGAHQPRDFT